MAFLLTYSGITSLFREVVDLSSDDEDVVVVDTVQGEASVSRTIDILMDERERIRNSRLRPSQVYHNIIEAGDG